MRRSSSFAEEMSFRIGAKNLDLKLRCICTELRRMKMTYLGFSKNTVTSRNAVALGLLPVCGFLLQACIYGASYREPASAFEQSATQSATMKLGASSPTTYFSSSESGEIFFENNLALPLRGTAKDGTVLYAVDFVWKNGPENVEASLPEANATCTIEVRMDSIRADGRPRFTIRQGSYIADISNKSFQFQEPSSGEFVSFSCTSRGPQPLNSQQGGYPVSVNLSTELILRVTDGNIRVISGVLNQSAGFSDPQ